MTGFRRLSEQVWASPQIDEQDVQDAASRGFALIINNRPEGESEDQVAGEVIEHAARAAGLDYRAIPIAHGRFSQSQVEEMERALNGAAGPVLAYCRSGTRSTFLWALAQARAGAEPEELARAAHEAGYDVSPIRPAMDSLSASR